MLKLVFLTKDFYSDYAHCKEIEKKPTRPHVCVAFLIGDNLCCVPMRSHIKHQYAIWTDKDNQCGLDFSKTVVITDPERYIDKTSKPYIRPNEFKVFQNISEYDVKLAMDKYLTQYKRAKARPHIPRNAEFLKYSCLQYFEDLIDL